MLEESRTTLLVHLSHQPSNICPCFHCQSTHLTVSQDRPPFHNNVRTASRLCSQYHRSKGVMRLATCSGDGFNLAHWQADISCQTLSRMMPKNCSKLSLRREKKARLETMTSQNSQAALLRGTSFWFGYEILRDLTADNRPICSCAVTSWKFLENIRTIYYILSKG